MNEASVQNYMISIDEHTHIFPTEYFLKKPHKIDNTLSKIEPITKIIENAVIDIKVNGRFTNHDLKKNAREIINPIGPDINTITNFLSKFSSLTYEKTDNVMCEKNAVFIYSVSSLHAAIQHIWMDYAKQLLYFYDLLKTSPETCIIFEIVPTIPESSSIADTAEQNGSININKIITFLSDIGLSNKIYTISHFSKLNSICTPLYIDKLQYLGYMCPTDYTRYISLANLLLDMDTPKITKKILEDNKDNGYNKLHLETNKQKYLILEKRVRSRVISESEYIRIYDLCSNYCKEHNLCLFIWDDTTIGKYTIYEQLVISSNAEIIIGYGGSMWMYNFTMNKGSVLVINTHSELLGYEIIDNIFLNACYIYGCNRDYYPEIKKYIHMHDCIGNDGIFSDIYTIVECFLLRLIKN